MNVNIARAFGWVLFIIHSFTAELYIRTLFSNDCLHIINALYQLKGESKHFRRVDVVYPGHQLALLL